MPNKKPIPFVNLVILGGSLLALSVVVFQLISTRVFGSSWDSLLALEVPYVILAGCSLFAGLQIAHARHYSQKSQPQPSNDKSGKSLCSLALRGTVLSIAAFGTLMYAVIYAWHREQMVVGIPLLIIGLLCSVALIPNVKAFVERLTGPPR